MCGIVGYIGDGNACDIIIDGLKKLEYRGYDSSGIAIYKDGKIEVRKYKGRIANLEAAIEGECFGSGLGIGHTRWATHGAPSDVNAHPHSNMDNSVAIVHNGIIENYMELREWLIKDHGIVFQSETDTEVIAHLVGLYYDGDLTEAVFKAVDQMRGAYGIVAV